jgi:hypothetical protein
MTKKQALTQEQIALLNDAFPVSDSNSRPSFPRLGMLSKDIIEESGKGKQKTINVIEAAGTFFTEVDKGEIDEETGKKKWTKTYLGDEIEVVIVFSRKQLRMYDEGLNKFFSTPIYDNADQVLPLYVDKKQVALGTPEQLQARFPTTTNSGKKSSKLKEETILFVLYEGELYQCNLSQSSKWAFKDYRKGLNPSAVFTKISSVEDTFGSNTFRKMVFTSLGTIDAETFGVVREFQENLKEQVISDAAYLLKSAEKKLLSDGLDKSMDDMVDEIAANLD